MDGGGGGVQPIRGGGDPTWSQDQGARPPPAPEQRLDNGRIPNGTGRSGGARHHHAHPPVRLLPLLHRVPRLSNTGA